MNKRPLYRALASKIQARASCEKSGNTLWFNEHSARIEETEQEHLPSGSGIDSGCTVDLDKSHAERIVINSSYHTMDEWGCYGEWIDFTVSVTPSLLCGFNLTITGRFGKHQDLKDYLHDVFYEALVQSVAL